MGYRDLLTLLLSIRLLLIFPSPFPRKYPHCSEASQVFEGLIGSTETLPRSPRSPRSYKTYKASSLRLRHTSPTLSQLYQVPAPMPHAHIPRSPSFVFLTRLKCPIYLATAHCNHTRNQNKLQQSRPIATSFLIDFWP